MTVFRSLPASVEVHPTGWAEVPGTGVEVTKLPVIDTAHSLPDGTPLFARLNYDDALAVAKRYGATLLKPGRINDLRKPGVAVQLQPYLGTPTEETELVHSERHDADVWRQLRALGWDGHKPVVGAGKNWVDGAPPGRSRLEGWDKDGAGPGQALWQPDMVAHNRWHFGDGTTAVLERLCVRATRDTDPPPDTERAPPIVPAVSSVVPPPDGAAGAILRLGSRGPDVERWQRIVSATADGIFGPGTEAKTKAWQAARGLVADGVVGPKSWAAAALPAPVVVAPVGLDLAAERTPITAATLFSVLSRVVPELGRESLLLLTAQSSHETDAWRSCWNFSLGNEKANPGWAGAYCYRYCDERLSPSGLRVAMASKSPRRDGNGDNLRVGATGTDGLTRVEFWPPHPQCRFRAFASLDEAAAAWLRLLRLPRYARAWGSLVAADLDAFARDLHAGGYYTATVGLYTFAMRARLAQVRASV